MKKRNMSIDFNEGKIIISKAFSKQASVYGTEEYKTLRSAVIETGYSVVVTTAQKKSYRGLSFERMEAYIKIQSNSEANLIEFHAVQKVAEAKGSKYPLTKQWFFAKFPEYKVSEISDNETKAVVKESEKESQAVMDNTVILPKTA